MPARIRHIALGVKDIDATAGAAACLKSEIERWSQVVRANKIEAPANWSADS
jgi:hypothetical protein